MNPDQIPGFAGKFFVIWILMVVGMIFTQALAIRWTLKTKWSDFKLVLVPANEGTEQNAADRRQ